MKPTKLTIAATCIGLALSATAFSEQEGPKGNPSKMPDVKVVQQDHLFMKDGVMMEMKNGKVTPMSAEAVAENGSKVALDGTVLMKDGSTMKLEEDDQIMMSGKIMKRDRIMMKDGVVVVVRDGKSAPMEQETALENGSRVLMDGTVMTKDGKTESLGQTKMVLMSGKIMDAPKAPTGPKSKTGDL